MKTALYPGLVTSGPIRRERRLELGGEVKVAEGQHVEPGTIIGLNGDEELRHFIRVEAEGGRLEAKVIKAPGDPVKRGETIAYHTYLFGLGYKEYVSPVDGVIEAVSEGTGTVTVKQNPTPVAALLPGVVAGIRADDAVLIELRATVISGRAGHGRPVQGQLHFLGDEAAAQPRAIGDEVRRRVVAITGSAGRELLGALFRRQAAGLVCGGLARAAALELERQVARLTPEEFAARYYDAKSPQDSAADAIPSEVGLTVVAIGGYGEEKMPAEVERVLRENHGRPVYLDGRVSVDGQDARPEVIIPLGPPGPSAAPEATVAEPGMTRAVGTSAPGDLAGRPARVMSGRLRGRWGRVIGLRSDGRVQLEFGLRVPAIELELPDGTRVLVPRANIEVYDAAWVG